MLGKLIKHEFRATGRLMAPLFGALLLLAVFVRVSDLILSAADAPVFFEALNALLLVVYVLAILGVTVFCHRPDDQALPPELPHRRGLSDVHAPHERPQPPLVETRHRRALFYASPFSPMRWLCREMSCWRGGTARDLFESIVGLFRELNSFYMANGIALALEILALLLVSLLVTCPAVLRADVHRLQLRQPQGPALRRVLFRDSGRFAVSSASQFSPAW